MVVRCGQASRNPMAIDGHIEVIGDRYVQMFGSVRILQRDALASRATFPDGEPGDPNRFVLSVARFVYR